MAYKTLGNSDTYWNYGSFFISGVAQDATSVRVHHAHYPCGILDHKSYILSAVFALAFNLRLGINSFSGNLRFSDFESVVDAKRLAYLFER